MTVIDTRKDTKYAGRIGDAIDLLKKGEIDEIITQGEHFVCNKREDTETGKLVRKKMLADYANAQIKYIIVGYNNDNERVVFTSYGNFSADFKVARLTTTEEAAKSVLDRIRTTNKCVDMQKDSLHIEQYLYRPTKYCSLRIYYNIHGTFTDYGTLSFIREQVEKGILLDRKDNRGKSYVYLSDLLIFKGKNITFTNVQGKHYDRVVDLRLLLHDGLIAFKAITAFVNNHKEFEVPEQRYLIRRSEAEKAKFYDLGAIIYNDEQIRRAAIQELNLQAWFE